MRPTLPTTWQDASEHPELPASGTHVWRIPLDRSPEIESHVAVLSDDEKERVRRFHFPHHGRRYAIAHSALRQILAAYENVDPRALSFVAGEHGKPSLAAGGVINPESLQFNLSHSGDLALLAVARHGAVGVDVERWRTNVQHLEIAERFFSPLERDALRALALSGRGVSSGSVQQAANGEGTDLQQNETILRGFFSTWSRKEAYLKATGHGITRGLYHFDVTLETLPDPTAREARPPARLLADRLDPLAIERWELTHIDVGPGYSGALVSARVAAHTPASIALFESPYI